MGVHRGFAADLLFAVPLLIAPVATLRMFGWSTVDPVATRLVGAALLAIGTQSLVGRNASLEAYRALLGLKSLWSASAILALALSLAEGAPPITAGLLAIFVGFAVVWNYYRLRLRPRTPAAPG